MWFVRVLDRSVIWGCCAALRGLARSHRFTTGLGTCAVPVGAGLPAIGLRSSPGRSLAANQPAQG
ncbi:hypothetical protein D0O09_31235, partial [Pseudomonas putida]